MENTAIGFPPTTIAVFVALAVIALAIDLFTHKSDKPVTLTNAAVWSIFWVLISLAFAGYLYYAHGPSVASLFVTGYALEKVLSVDNLFVFMAIFAWFKIPDALRHRVLYWGIIGAIVFRLIFVAIGTGLLAFGPWVEVLFAVVVAWTATATAAVTSAAPRMVGSGRRVPIRAACVASRRAATMTMPVTIATGTQTSRSIPWTLG